MRRNKKIYKWLAYGLFLFTVGSTVFIYQRTLGYIICSSSLVIVLIAFLSGGINIRMPFNGFNNFLFISFIFWIVGIFLRPFFFIEDSLSNGFSLNNPYLGLSYLIPFFVIFSKQKWPVREIVNFAYMSGFIGFVCMLYNYDTVFSTPPVHDYELYQNHIVILNLSTTFLFTASSFLLFVNLNKRKFILMGILSGVGVVLISLIGGRRGNFLIQVLVFIFFFIHLYLFNNKKNNIYLFSTILVLVVVSTIYLLNNFDTYFSFFGDRIKEGSQSRDGIEYYFLRDFKSPQDWIVGRGINGSYRSPFETMNRGIIETGYLQIILKGGGIYLLLILYFWLSSIVKGFLFSQNSLTKGLSFYILIHIVYLYPFGLLSFSFEYLIIWICVIYCHSSKVRSMSDSELFS